MAILLSEGTKTFTESKGKILLNFLSISGKLNELENNIAEILNIDFLSEEDSALNLSEVWKQKAERWLANIELLKDWISWTRIKENVINSGLTPVVNVYEGGNLKNEEVLIII